MPQSRKVWELICEKSRAGVPGVYLLSPEDFRAREEIRRAAKEVKRKLYYWTMGKGLFEISTNGDKISKDAIEGTAGPPGVLKYIASVPQRSIVVLRLFHHFMDNPDIQSALLDLLEEYRKNKRLLIVLSPVRKLPAELEKEFILIEHPLPDAEDLDAVIEGVILGSELKGEEILQKEVRTQLVEAASGLSATEAENAICLSFIRGRAQNNPWDPRIVQEEKCYAIRKGGFLDFIPTGSEGMKQVGGLLLYKNWLSRRVKAFTKEARDFGLPIPKGVLMVGPPGSGKSMAARATAETMRLPLLRCDIAALFGMYVGQSEANVRKALELAETAAPCVLWLDEIDKAFAGSRGTLDSGVGARVFGSLLTWMQEKTAPVFVYATSNEVQSLPSELLRKGRFDELFSVLLPTFAEREEIFRIHINKRNRGSMLEGNPPKIDTKMLAQASAGYSGSEIEEAVIEALYIAFEGNRDLNMVDLQEAISATRPLSRTMEEQFRALEKWCKERTRPANAPEEKPVGLEALKESPKTAMA